MSISIQNINKHFGDYHALNNINLNINDGELTALLGPSGCGKSTLLRVIAGLESEDSGKILFDNDVVTNLAVQQRNIGFVFQNYALFRHMTVADNVAFGLKVKSRKERPSNQEIKQRVKTLLELVQLEHLSERYPDQLSGGQRQRIALARAIASDPKVLLLDEPFSALDAKVRKELRRWLRDFHHEINITTIFVTHDQEEALEVADKIVLMNQGKIEQIGTPEQVYKQPKSAFVAHFLGDVNLLHGFIQNNELHLGGFVKKLTNQHWNDQAIVAYVRPHEIYLSKIVQENSIVGKISKLHAIGPTVLLEIMLKDRTYFEASISYFEFEKGQYKVGDVVYFNPSLVNIFMQDELVEFII